ncbi:DUF4405 domain-containing protein [Candidatus Korarchaeum cryptofilum]|jgi:hypothetical protein|uniref:Flavinylation-associated cytochrome domain-containing protein n=2 Tax=Candidatus Korarchaeum cryptofilum TaxID=498846 RepID=B1L3S4_KORCO|nr:DUF4405 domain-containing protein [Candidatus Korarchaeum cryptofilum]ACB07103.1 hypothetical protein Kcr_0347 [Candidatus Korarchaeum cryptofilum OPF8]RSN67687.1 DUF4405 domain-containing protein [Candidatus Korarchaeum cryptofilum]
MSGELKLRAIVSIAQLVLGILLFISGLVLYFTPSGRAHEFIIFMSRGSWRYWHDIFAFAFSGSSLIHIYFNFRSLKVLARRLFS